MRCIGSSCRRATAAAATVARSSWIWVSLAVVAFGAWMSACSRHALSLVGTTTTVASPLLSVAVFGVCVARGRVAGAAGVAVAAVCLGPAVRAAPGRLPSGCAVAAWAGGFVRPSAAGARGAAGRGRCLATAAYVRAPAVAVAGPAVFAVAVAAPVAVRRMAAAAVRSVVGVARSGRLPCR